LEELNFKQAFTIQKKDVEQWILELKTKMCDAVKEQIYKAFLDYYSLA